MHTIVPFKGQMCGLTPYSAPDPIFGPVHIRGPQIMKGPDGKEKPSEGRWTDILMKQGDKWVLIGDHGGKTSKD